jgi:hypothetical protein
MKDRQSNFRSWAEVALALDDPAESFPPMAVITGPPESGKTTLVQRWLDSVQNEGPFQPPMQYCVAHTGETPLQFCVRMLRGLKVEPAGNDLGSLAAQLGAALHAAVAFLIIDQAELLPLPTLQLLQAYVFDTWGLPLLLVGRPELRVTLSRDENLADRVSAWGRIEQFDPAVEGAVS